MKPMIYKPNREIELLHSGEYRGKYYIIVSMGTHPNAYVFIRKGEKYFGKSYGEIDDITSQDINYSGSVENLGDIGMDFDLFLINNKLDGLDWMIGWDYSHTGDYSGYYLRWDTENEGKKWTTEEIDKEVKLVIDELLDGDENE